MAAIVKGHGVDPDGEDTFIPEGSVVRMYSAETVNLSTTIALLAMLDECGDPGEEIRGTIKNYSVHTQDDRYIARWLEMGGESSIPIWWVGNDIPNGTRLCEDPNRNSDDPEAMTCRAQGVHTCTGVLGLVTDPEIALVACRGSRVEAASGQKVPTAYDTTAEGIDQLVKDYIAEVRSGDENRIRQAEDDSDHIPVEVRDLMISNLRYDDWQRLRWLKEFANQNDLEGFFGQLQSNKARLTQMMALLDQIPPYADAVDRVATDHPETFVQWLAYYQDGQVRAALLTRPAIAQVVEQVETLGSVQNLYN